MTGSYISGHLETRTSNGSLASIIPLKTPILRVATGCGWFCVQFVEHSKQNLWPPGQTFEISIQGLGFAIYDRSGNSYIEQSMYISLLPFVLGKVSCPNGET